MGARTQNTGAATSTSHELALRIGMLTLIGCYTAAAALVVALLALSGTWEQITIGMILITVPVVVLPYMVRHTRFAELSIYLLLGLLGLIVASSAFVSGVATGDAWIMFQVGPLIGTLTIRKPRAALISAVLNGLLLSSSVALELTGVIPVKLLLPRELVLENLGFHLIALAGTTIALMLITRREQQALAREQQARQLIRFVMHELRGHTAGLKGLAPLLRRQSGVAATGPALFGALDESVAQLDELMQRLLVLTRETLPATQHQPVELAPLLARAREEARHFAHQLGLAPTIEIGVEDQLVVKGDPLYLSMAFETALRNAIEALRRMPQQGQALLRIEASAHDSAVRVRIRDSGPGFPQALLDDMAQAPVSSQPGWSSKPGGEGLGLALIQQVVELHQGSVRFGNEQPAPGAWVEFELLRDRC